MSELNCPRLIPCKAPWEAATAESLLPHLCHVSSPQPQIMDLGPLVTAREGLALTQPWMLSWQNKARAKILLCHTALYPSPQLTPRSGWALPKSRKLQSATVRALGASLKPDARCSLGVYTALGAACTLATNPVSSAFPNWCCSRSVVCLFLKELLLSNCICLLWDLSRSWAALRTHCQSSCFLEPICKKGHLIHQAQ